MKRELPLLPDSVRNDYEIREWNHALAILYHDFKKEWDDLVYVLKNFKLTKSSILQPGGGKSPIAKNINGMFYERSWSHKSFDIAIFVDKERRHTQTHKVDYFKNRIAVETEWNNKDPFYDRDLNNFRLLHSLRVISLGIIITRCDSLQKIFDRLGKGSSYGASTTHMSKLLPRVENGGSGGCPVLAIGISDRVYDSSQ